MKKKSKLDSWYIDTSTGTKILMYDKCSVIEDEQAEYVLGLIAKDKGEHLTDGTPCWCNPRIIKPPPKAKPKRCQTCGYRSKRYKCSKSAYWCSAFRALCIDARHDMCKGKRYRIK